MSSLLEKYKKKKEEAEILAREADMLRRELSFSEGTNGFIRVDDDGNLIHDYKEPQHLVRREKVPEFAQFLLRITQPLQVGMADDRAHALYRAMSLLAQVNTAKAGATLLVNTLNERHRQMTDEGFDPDHDTEYDSQELIRAGISYLILSALPMALSPQGMDKRGRLYELTEKAGEFLKLLWPWKEQWLKPKSLTRNLERGIALILAHADKEHLYGPPAPQPDDA